MSGEKKDYGDFVDLLINKPLHSSIVLPDPTHKVSSRGPGIGIPTEVYEAILKIPSIELHCSSDKCGGIRVFETDSSQPKLDSKKVDEIIHYQCRNCKKSFKTFWLAFLLSDKGLEIKKLGEYPPYGPHTPANLISLLGTSRDLFLKGRRCESQGLGIGAFTYYRRVLDNQKNTIIDELIRVAEIVKTDTTFIESLQAAKQEDGFANSVDKIKPLLPDSILLNGNNPLSLLNTALSTGIHAKTDEECLEIAQYIRVVLAMLAIRLHELLKDDQDLKDAISNINKFRTKP